MTKRFTHQQIYDGISEHEQFYDNHKRMRYDEVCDKLNEQDQRIQKLESRLSIATQLLKQFKLYYIFMDKLEDVEEIHHWSKEEVNDE